MRLVLSALIVLSLASKASAHRLDEYLQATRIELSPNRIGLAIDLTLGAAVAAQMLPMIDGDGDGQVSDQEAQAYAARVVADLWLEVNGQGKALHLLRVDVPSVPALADGLGTVHLELEAVDTAVRAGRSSLTFRNDHQLGLSAYLVNALVPASTTIEITGQERDVRQQGIRLAYNVSPDGPGFPSWSWLVAGAVFLSVMRFRQRRALRWPYRAATLVTLAALLYPSGGMKAQPGPEPSVAMIAASGSWPRWRGPSGQGLAGDSGYPDTWSDTQNVVWRTRVPGRGHSSPIIWGDRIFLTTAYTDGRAAVVSFRRSDGRQLWDAVVPDRAAEHLHPKNSHASATPTTDGTRVFASFGSKGVLAADFDGRVLWHRSLGAIDNYHGTAGSPLLYKDKLILFQDQPGGAFITALETATGRTLWRTGRQGSVGWSTPIAIRAFDHDEIIVSSERRVNAYDPVTGRALWNAGGNLFEVIPTPVVGHGLVFCSSGRAGPTLAIRPGGKGDVTKTHVAWQSPRGSPFVPSPILYGDYLYIVNDMASTAASLEAATGKLMWQGRLGVATREGFSASPVGVDGKLFFTNDEGETFVVKAGPTFELLHVNRLNARTLASPALTDRRWYFRTDQDLLAIGR